MDKHGDAHKQIWITEVGWSTAEGVTSQEQANLLVQSLVTALSVREKLKVEKFFWFCVKDWGGPSFGLFDTEGKCLETPAEPPESRICSRVRQKAYPVQERSGIVFAFLGEGTPPVLPAAVTSCCRMSITPDVKTCMPKKHR